MLGYCQYDHFEENCPKGCFNNACAVPNCEWIPISTENAPKATAYARALWMPEVGKMLVIGGLEHDTWASTYDPEADRWESVADCNTGHYNPGLVWTGAVALMWGEGGLYYDPTEGLCSGLPSPPVELGTRGPSAAWTGSEMIIWGGSTGVDTIVGARYAPGSTNPGQGLWTATSTGSGCPSERGDHATVWTGDRMIVWGGSTPPGANPTNSGALYDPESDTWVPTSTGPNCPSPRATGPNAAVWTGEKMIIWGGGGGTGCAEGLGDGGLYDPRTDSWDSISATDAPAPRHLATAVWTGREMIVWGGSPNGGLDAYNDGGRYYPSIDTWTPIETDNAPSPRYGHVAVWTGKEMIVWGGQNNAGSLGDGAIYRCQTDGGNAGFGRLWVMANPIRVRAVPSAGVAWDEFIVTISNIGSEDLVIDDIYVKGDPDFSCPMDGLRFPYTDSGNPSCSVGPGMAFFTCYFSIISGDQARGLLVVETHDPTSPSVEVPIVLDLVGDLTPNDWGDLPQEQMFFSVKPNPVRISPLPVGQSLVIELCYLSMTWQLAPQEHNSAKNVMVSTEGDAFSVLRVEDGSGNTLPLPFDCWPDAYRGKIFVEYRPLEDSHEDGRLVVRFTDDYGLRQTLKVPLTFQ
jgi:hypothetical protein